MFDAEGYVGNVLKLGSTLNMWVPLLSQNRTIMVEVDKDMLDSAHTQILQDPDEPGFASVDVDVRLFKTGFVAQQQEK
jgi:hypothetical protein